MRSQFTNAFKLVSAPLSIQRCHDKPFILSPDGHEQLVEPEPPACHRSPKPSPAPTSDAGADDDSVADGVVSLGAA